MHLRISKITVLAACLVGSSAFAAGFEKTIMWGGESAGLAGVAVPNTEGSEALYFNPAGLVSDKQGQDLSFNISPTWTTNKAPVNNLNEESTSEMFNTPAGLVYGITPNEKWGFGGGVYVAGGSSSKHDGITVGTLSHEFEASTDIQLIELALGAGYKVSEKLKVGMAWRVMMASASMKTIQRGAGSTTNLELNDMKDTQFTGFKLGAQYQLNEKTNIGLTYRSEVHFSLDGTYGGAAYTAGPTFAIAESDVTAKSALPQAVQLGFKHVLNEKWNLYGQYDWINYSIVNNITIDGALTVTGVGTTDNPADMETKWDDQHTVRLGAEYLGWSLPFRFGYAWATKVSNLDFATATTTPPAAGHLFTVGTGYSFGENFKLNGAIEYVPSYSAEVSAGADAGTTGTGTDMRNGEYSASAYTVHLGLAYNF